MSEAGRIEPLHEAARQLRQAQRIIATGRLLEGAAEEWLLVATLVGEADLAVRAARRRDPNFSLPLLDAVVEELEAMTAGFTDPAFLRATKAARRRNPELFRVGG